MILRDGSGVRRSTITPEPVCPLVLFLLGVDIVALVPEVRSSIIHFCVKRSSTNAFCDREFVYVLYEIQLI